MTLAIDGGSPARTKPFPPWPQYDDRERDALSAALDQGQWWRLGGKEVSTFEDEFAAFHGAEAALAVTNGTHAIELALELLGVAAGDEVVVPAFTFASTFTAVQRLGAVPVPVDVDLDTYCMTAARAAEGLSPRSRAVVPVHLAGHVADMDGLGALAARAGVPLLQDAAHAQGARWRGRRLGELGPIACFSFQNGKLMTAGEGGALLLPAALHEEAFVRHSCGRPSTDRRYEHRTPSSNFRMNEFSAAVLRVQLTRLAGQLERREQRWATLARLLSEVPGIVPQGRSVACDLHSHYMAMFRIDRTVHPDLDRDAAVDALVAEGIPAFVNYPAIYRTAAFWRGPSAGLDALGVDGLAERCPNAEVLGRDGIWIHHRVLLGDDADVADVADAVAKVVAGLRAGA